MSDGLSGWPRRHSVIMREILLIFSPDDGEEERREGRNPVAASSAAFVFTAHFHRPLLTLPRNVNSPLTFNRRATFRPNDTDHGPLVVVVVVYVLLLRPFAPRDRLRTTDA